MAELVVSKLSWASEKGISPIVQTSTYVFIMVLTSSWLRLYRDSQESWPSFGPLGGTIWTIRLSRALATRSGAMAALSRPAMTRIRISQKKRVKKNEEKQRVAGAAYCRFMLCLKSTDQMLLYAQRTRFERYKVGCSSCCSGNQVAAT